MGDVCYKYNAIDNEIRGQTQTWYADDGVAGGTLLSLCRWWVKLAVIGPEYGYCPNSSKSWLVAKDKFSSLAADIFVGTNIKITNIGKRFLGAAIKTRSYVEDFQKRFLPG